MHPELIEICRYFRGANSGIDLNVHTNGGSRRRQFWSELAPYLTSCTFGIDGLADTNAMYRRGTNWDRIMENVTAFIDNSGRAIWHYIVFSHNEHQIDSARDLAEKMGFAKFVLKRTGRFLKENRLQSSTPIFDHQGRTVGFLRPPENPLYANPQALTIAQELSSSDDYNSFILRTTVDCKAIREKTIYVNAQGFVFPCCWLAQFHPLGEAPSAAQAQIKALLDLEPGVENLDARGGRIREVLEVSAFHREVPRRWEQGSVDRLIVCARTCGSHSTSACQKMPVSP
jgi:hypothetical protein